MLPSSFRAACTVAVTVFALTAGVPAAHAAPLDAAQVRQWQQDLDYLAQEMPRRHRNLYHTVTREAFAAALDSLRQRLPALERHQVIVELARVVALVGDGHTNVAPTRDPAIGFGTYPLQLYFFQDGLYVRATDSAHAALLGARVTAFGGVPVEQAYARVREIIGKDNEMGARFFAPHLLVMPEVLHALGLAGAVDAAELTVERNGQRDTVRLAPSGRAPMMPPDTDTSWLPPPGWVDARGDAAHGALWLRHPDDKYWFDYLPASRTWYVQFNQVTNKADESIDAFTRRLLAAIDARPAERLVLDLRLNRGGNRDYVPAIVRMLIKARSLDAPGHLFVLTGRGTFSAAQFLVNDIERMTEAVLVGEPTGGKPNSHGDSRKIMLPHSGITVRVSTLWWQEDERDLRLWTAPAVAAELTFEDYRSNRDPAMATVLAYRLERPLAETLTEAYERGGAEAGQASLTRWRADPRHKFADIETPLNQAAYALAGHRHPALGIDVLEQAADLYPASANVQDSLGELHASMGHRELALRHYRAAIRVQPGMASAAEGIAKLGRQAQALN